MVRWFRLQLAKNGSQEDLERFDYTLEQANPRLHLYTLAQKRATPVLVSGDNGFLAAMQEIDAVKRGG